MASLEPGANEAPLVGQLVNGRYKVLSVLDRGGMGVIYRAEQQLIGRMVALKVLASDRMEGDIAAFSQRFLMEASTCAKLSHPNTVTLYDFGKTEDGSYYIAMELLQGRNLQQLLDQEKQLSAVRTLHILLQIAGSLSEAHEHGIVHRDLKPGNVFLTAYGDDEDFVKVLDFGLAKQITGKATNITQQGLLVGSPRFMSPEQIRSQKLDGRSDIYSLGAIMYRCLTGRYVFDSEEQVAIILGHVNEAPPPFQEIAPSVLIPQNLEAVVMRCLAKSPEDRYGSVEELRLALEDVLTALGDGVHNTTLRMSRNRVMALAQQSVRDEVEDTGEHSLAGQGPKVPSTARRLFWPLLTLLAVTIAIYSVMATNQEAVPVKSVDRGAIQSPKSVDIKADPVASEPGATSGVLPSGDGMEDSVELMPLMLVTDPPGATVFWNGNDIGDSPIELMIPEGESWALTIRLAKHKERTITVYGGQRELTLKLKPQPPASKGPKAQAGKSKPPKSEAVEAEPPVQSPPKSAERPSELRDPWGD